MLSVSTLPAIERDNMLTITHSILRGGREYNIEVREEDGSLPQPHMIFYHAGLEEPNYPMPAIPIRVDNILNGPPFSTTSRYRQQTYWKGTCIISRYKPD